MAPATNAEVAAAYGSTSSMMGLMSYASAADAAPYTTIASKRAGETARCGVA